MRKIKTVFVLAGVMCLIVLFLGESVNGASFPDKLINFIVASGVGGGEDTEARAIAPFLKKHLSVDILIQNQVGAGGKIAFEKFQRTKPDGYTLITYTFPRTIIEEYMGKTNYRTKDFIPILAWSRHSQILVVNTETWKTFDEFLKTAKTRTLVGGTSSRGSTTHVAGMIAMDELGIKVNWVPFDSAAQSLAALAGKHVDFTMALSATALPLIDAGKIRGLVLFSDERDPYLPEVPIPKDLGYSIPSIQAIRGVEAPPGTPASIVKILEEAFRKAVKEPSFIEYARKRKLVLHTLNAQEFGKLVTETYPMIEKLQLMLKE